MENFLYLEKFLDKLPEIHSTIDITIEVIKFTPAKILTSDKLKSIYKLIYLKSSYSEEIQHMDAIFQHSSGYYIYLSRKPNSSEFQLKIIYKSEKYEEIKLFINNLKKII